MFVELNGIKLYYEEYGAIDGETVICLHGNGGSMKTFYRTALLIRGKRVILIDSRGHGRTEFDGHISIPMMASDVAEFVRLKGLENVSLIGYSDGGNIAIEAAAFLGGKVKKLVAVGANTRVDGMTAQALLGIKLSYLKFCLLACFPRYRTLKKHFEIMVKQPEITDETLSRITAKTLVIAGEHDMIKDSHTCEIVSKIAGASLAVIGGGDHFLFSKKSDEVHKVILEFLE
jgi:pimeloyl-ACP methyl ester carboxylesterase